MTYAAVTLELVSTTDATFFGGKFLNGFAIGFLQSVTVTYIGDVTPLALRGFFTFLSAASYIHTRVSCLRLDRQRHGRQRHGDSPQPLAQYGFAGFATVGVFSVPESPWWLASKGRDERALENLFKLGHTG
ncbi:hypothetical protein MCOR02_006717 [Pyricularia oryzae]|nr:hypothetical protein MCOR02_006717 [Pyricularia oryzae]